jgi:Fe-S-cluster containining protein
MPKLQFELKVGDSTISAEVNLPAEPIRPVDLLPVLHAFNDALIGIAVDKAEAAGQRISCHAGCGACCRQMVPISETEAFHLADLILAMDDDRKSRVTARFDEALRGLADCGMLDRLRSSVPFDPEELHRLGVEYFRLGLACPFLEDESCSIHRDRPSICREYLVTSPAANCSAPSADNIAKIPLPAKLSRILFRFGDGVGEQPPRWLPLPLLLDWTAGHKRDTQPAILAPQLFENFMRKVVPQAGSIGEQNMEGTDESKK